MKLCQLDLIAFGPFENASLDLDQGDPGLHVIYGDNEDGKSTTLRAIRGLLFGIDERTGDDHRFMKSKLRVGGRLRRSTGEELRFLRRKGRKDTLLDPDTDSPLADDALDPFLGGVSEQVFSSLYGIDHEELVSGGRAILEQTGEVGKALYSAATGTASLKSELDTMEREADALFKPKAKTSRINVAARDHKNKLQEAKVASLSSSAWTKLQREHEDVGRRREKLDEERRGLQSELARLQRVKRVRPLLAERAEFQMKREAVGRVVDLPVDFEDSRRVAVDMKRAAQERLLQIAAKVEKLKGDEAESQHPDSVLGHAETIEGLYRKLGDYESKLQDKPGQVDKWRVHTNDARDLLKAIRSDLDVKEVETMRPLRSLKGAIQKLISQHEKLSVEEERAERSVRDVREEQKALQLEQSRSQEERDPIKLKAALRAAQKAGDLDGQVQEAADRCHQRQEQVRLGLGRLGLWQGSLQDLESASLPGEDTVEHFDKDLREHGRKEQRLADKLHELVSERQEIEEQIAALEHGGQLPSPDELVASRTHRDRGWGMVRRKCFEQVDVEQDIQHYTDGRPLPDVYESAVSDADDVADRLRSDAERVQKRGLLELDLGKNQRKAEKLQAEQDALGLRLTELQQGWQQVWAHLRLEPISPREMGTWLRRAETLRQNIEEQRREERERVKLRERRAGLLANLVAEFEHLGVVLEEQPGELLGSVLERALLLLEEIDTGLGRRRDLEKAAQKASTSLAGAEAELKSLQGRRKQWAREWSEAVRDFDFLAEPGVTRVAATLEQLEDLFKAVDKASAQHRRIYGIEQALSEYQTEVDRVAEVLARPRGDQGVDPYVSGLHAELARARERETQLKSLQQQREELNVEAAEHQAVVQAADARLVDLRSQAWVDSDEDLHEAGRRSTHARELVASIEDRERQVLAAGDGLSLDELVQQAQGVDGDGLEGQIASLAEELEHLNQRRDEALQREGELRQEIAASTGTNNAAEATEQAEQALSQMREDVRTYLRLRASSLILKNQIESYRQQNQAPVLKRASELFARLTQGSFKALRDELDSSGRPILLGVRSDDQEVKVEGMSDGTRDQLYLALRLGTLEQHLAVGEPIPFIVDDILVGFDDDRTKACLRVFSELAQKTQVLLFTHHKRVAELATPALVAIQGQIINL